MGARDKLNLMFLGGALVVAAVIGAVLNSWGAFCLAALVLIFLSLVGFIFWLSELGNPSKVGAHSHAAPAAQPATGD